MLLTVQHHPPQINAAALQDPDTHQGVIDGSEAASCYEKDWQLQPADQLQDGFTPIDRYQQASRSLDNQMGSCMFRQLKVFQQYLNPLGLGSGVWTHRQPQVITLRMKSLSVQAGPAADLFCICPWIPSPLNRFPITCIQTGT